MKRNFLFCGVMTLLFVYSRALAYEDDYLTTTDSGVTVIDTEEGNRVYVFTTAGTELTATLKRDMKLDQVLLVGGGGGGGGYKGGGGGAGQVIYLENLDLIHAAGVSYRFTVGSGGTAGTSAFNAAAGDGGEGSATSFGITGADIGGSASYSAVGGGGGRLFAGEGCCHWRERWRDRGNGYDSARHLVWRIRGSDDGGRKRRLGGVSVRLGKAAARHDYLFQISPTCASR